MEHAPTLRVAINTTSTLGRQTGIGYYTAALIEALRRQSVDVLGHHSRLWFPAGPDAALGAAPETPSPLRRARRRLISLAGRLPGLRAGFERLRDRRNREALEQGLQIYRPDLYHEPNFVAPRLELPTVITVHDLSCFRFPQFHPVDRVRFMQRHLPAAIAVADRIIAVSEFTKREIVDYFGVAPERISVTRLAADRRFAPLAAADAQPVLLPWGLAWRGYFLFVGSLEPRKNLALVLDAYAALPAAVQRRYPLVLAGAEGWRREHFQGRLRRLAESGLVRELGYVPHEALPALYAGCAGFLFPSVYEGFGLPPLEAMACGAPVVVSAKASLPEVVGDGALIVSGDDPDELAGALRRLVEDPAAPGELTTRGLARASEFSWDRTGSETLTAYRQAIHSRS